MLQNNYNLEGLEPERKSLEPSKQYNFEGLESESAIDPRRFGIPEGAGEPISTITGKPVLTDFGIARRNDDLRADGTKKGRGYLGELKRLDGGISTELSVGVNFDGKEIEIPSIIPGLEKEELDYLLNTKPSSKMWEAPIGQTIIRKATKHARQRMDKGKSPFFDDREEGKQYNLEGLEPEAPKEYGFMDKWREIKKEGVIPFVPFLSGAKEVKDIAQIASSAYKLDQGTATPEEKNRLISFVQEANKDTDFWYKTLDVVSQMPAFMGEFLLTGGIYAAGRKVGTKVATKSIKKVLGKSGQKLLKRKIGRLGVKVAAGVAGATVQAPIMGLPRIISGTIERSMPKLQLTENERGEINVMIAGEGEDLLPAFTKALGDQWAETVSEHSGGLFGMLGRSAKNTVIKTGLFSAFLKANPKMPVNKAVSFFKKMGYHGVINEMLEERLGEGLRAGLGVQKYQLPTVEQLGVELVSFSVPGVVQGIGARAFKEKPEPEPSPEDIIPAEARVGLEPTTLDNIKEDFKSGAITIDHLIDFATIPEAQEAGISDEINTLALKSLTPEELDNFSESHPNLRPIINDIIGDNIAGKINEEIEDAERIRGEIEEAGIKERADREAEERLRVRDIEKDRMEAKKREKKKALEEKAVKPTPTPEKTKVALEEMGVEKKPVEFIGMQERVDETPIPLVNELDTKSTVTYDPAKHEMTNLAEYEKAVAGEKAEVKESWEMTKEEFVRDKELREIADIEKKRKKYKESLKNKSTAGYYAEQKYPYTVNTSVELQAREAKNHKRIIQKALSEGKPVPESILAEYPDLKAPTPKPPKARPSEAVTEEIKGEAIPKIAWKYNEQHKKDFATPDQAFWDWYERQEGAKWLKKEHGITLDKSQKGEWYLAKKTKAIPEVAPKPEKEKVEVTPEKKEPWKMTKKEILESIRTIGKKDVVAPNLISMGKGILTEGMTINDIPASEIPGWEKALESHRKDVKQAIEEGKIDSHPDYPELTREKEKLEVETTPEDKEISQEVWENLTLDEFEKIPLKERGQYPQLPKSVREERLETERWVEEQERKKKEAKAERAEKKAKLEKPTGVKAPEGKKFATKAIKPQETIRGVRKKQLQRLGSNVYKSMSENVFWTKSEGFKPEVVTKASLQVDNSNYTIPRWAIIVNNYPVAEVSSKNYREIYTIAKNLGFTPPRKQPYGVYPRSSTVSGSRWHVLIEHTKGNKIAELGATAFGKKWENAKDVFLRYGSLPKHGKSTNWVDGTIEEGVSVFRGKELPTGEVTFIIGSPQAEGTKLHLALDKKLYVVGGDVVGVGADGEPLLQNSKIIRQVKPHKIFSIRTTKPQDTITRADLKSIFAKMKNISTGVDKDGNFFFRPLGKPVVTIYEVNEIEGYMDTSKGRIPVGSFLGNTIELKTGGEGHTADIGTAWHEYEHWMEVNGILSNNDIKALDTALEKQGITPNTETRAEYIGDRLSEWQGQKNLRIKRVLKKIADFVNSIWEFVTRTRTARGVLADIETGKILSDKELSAVNQFAQDVSFSLKKAAKKITDNPNFVKWFGDSKILNKDGSPKVVYHGTDKDFTEFDKRKIGAVFGEDKKGFFFTDILHEAEYVAEYVADTKGGENIMPVYLSLKNPYKHKTKGIASIYFDNHRVEIMNAAGEDNNDGIIINGYNGNLYVAFEPTQIKSIFNTGAFGITEPDIMFQMAGEKAIEETKQFATKPTKDYRTMLRRYQEAGIKKPSEKLDEIGILEKEIQALRKQFKQDIKTTPIKESVKEATGKLRLSDIVKEARIITRKTYEAIAKRKKGIALIKLKERYRNSLIKAKARKEASARVNKIIKGLKKIDTEKMSPPQAKAIDAILQDIDLTKLSSKKRLRLEKTKRYLDGNPDAEMPSYVLKDLERLSKKSIRDLTLDEFESLNIAVLHHAHLDKVKQTIRVGREMRRSQQTLDDSLTEMKPAKKVKDNIVSSQTGKLGKLKRTGRLIADTFGIRHDHFDLIIESLAGPNSTMDKVLYQGVKEGITEELKYKQNTFKKFQDDLGDFNKKHKIKDITKWLSETVKTGKFELTRGERTALYRHSLNPDNKRAIIEGGFGFKFSEKPNKVHRITKDEFNSIIDSLSDAEKDFAGKPLDNLFADQVEKLDKIFLEKNGYALPREENYYPKDTMPLARAIDVEVEDAFELFKGKWLRVGVSKGMLEKRKRVALPIYLNSITHDINKSVAKSSAYIGLEIPLSNASKLLYNPTFRLNLSNKYGEQVWKEIEKGLRDIAGEYQTYTTTEKLLIKAKNRLAVAMLGVNPFVMAKQVLSLPVYLPYVKSRYLSLGIIDSIWNPGQVLTRHKLYSPELLERIEGGYSRDVADVFKAGAEKRIYAGQKSIKEKFMGGIKLFDKMAVMAGTQGAVLQTLDEFKAGKLSREVGIALDMKDSDIAGLSPEQKMKLAYKFADYATQRTQPMFSPEHRSSLSRGSAVEKLATMFGSFTNQALNLTRRSYREAIRTGDKEAYAKFAKSLMVIFVINTMGVMAIDDIRDRLYGRDDRPLWGRILSSWSAYMFFVRDLASSVVSKIERGTFLGYDVSLPISRIPELLSNSIANGVNTLTEKDIKKRKKAAINFIDDSLELSMMLYGIPYATPKKLAARVVLGAPDVDSKEVKDFKENLKEINIIDKNYKELLKEDQSKAFKYDTKTNRIRRLKSSFSKTSSQLGEQRKRKERIMSSKAYTSDQKRKLIDNINARMTRIAKSRNKVLSKHRR